MSDGPPIPLFTEDGAQTYQPPFSPEAEVSVIGAMLIDPDAVAEARATLSASDFYREAHRRLFRAMCQVVDEGLVLDAITLQAQLKDSGDLEAAGGLEYLADLLDAVPTGAHVGYHARVVKEKARLRRLIEASQATIREALSPNGSTPAEVFRRAEERVYAVAGGGGVGHGGFRDPGEAVMAAMELIEQEAEAKGGVTGIPTGFPKLDRMTTGMQRGDVTIIAARPSQGKSALAWCIAAHAAAHGHATAFCSYEMPSEQITKRGLAVRGNIDLMKIRRGELGDDEYRRLSDAASWIAKLPLFTDDHPDGTLSGLQAKLRRLMTSAPIRLVVVDYLQLMTGPGENRVQEVSSISRGLKKMARDMDVHVLALSQLSRGVESRKPPRPMLSDLRESGSIEQDADVVLMLWRPEYYFDDTTPDDQYARWQGKAELIVSKQRNGPTGSMHLHFEKTTTRFTELAPEPGV